MLVVITVLLSFSSVQTKLATWIMNSINNRYGVAIQIATVKASMLNFNMSLEEVLIQDEFNDTIVYASRVQSKLYHLPSFLEGSLQLGNLEVHDLKLEVNTPKDSTENQLNRFLQKLGQRTTQQQTAPLIINELEVHKGSVKIHNFNQKNSSLHFDQIEINVTDIQLEDKIITAEINQLSFLWNGFKLSKAATEFYYSPEQMRFEDLALFTENSYVKGTLNLDYTAGGFKDFYNSVNFHLSSDEVHLNLDEFNQFKPLFGDGLEADLSLNLDGIPNDFTAAVQYLNISNTGIRGVFNIKHLFETNHKYQLEASIKNLESNPKDLKRIVPAYLDNVLPTAIDRLGKIQITGTTKFTNDLLISNNNIKTDLGTIYSDIQIDQIQDLERAMYRGFISLIDFNLGNYLFDNDSFSNTSMDANISGVGFLRSAINTKAEGLVYKTTYKGYSYQNIELSGLFKNELFDGTVVVADPNCQLEFKGLADVGNNPNEFNFKAEIQQADLHQLNFVTDSIALFKGTIISNLIGTTIDDAVGSIDFKNTYYSNTETNFNFEDFSIKSEQVTPDQRRISINSKDIVTGAINGNFKLLEIAQLFENSMGSVYSNYIPHQLTKNQKFDFNFKVYNKLIEVFLPQLQFAPKTTMRGEVIADQNNLKIDFKSPSVRYNQTILDSVTLKIDTKNPLFKSYASIGTINHNYYQIKDFEVINNNIKDTLFFRTEFTGLDAKKDTYALNFYHTFNENKESVIGLKRSTIKLKGYDWLVNSSNDTANKVVFTSTRDSIQIDRIIMNSKIGEQIEIQGHIKDSTQKNIQVSLNKVAFKKITPSIDSLALDGNLTGVIRYQQTDSLFYPSSKVTISKFSVNDFVLGTLEVDVLGANDLNTFIVNGNISTEDEERLRIIGAIKRGHDGIFQSDMLASFNGFRLEPFSPLGKEVIHRIRGSLFGNAKILGSLTNPTMKGELTLSQGGIMFPYLNMDYDFGPTETIVLNDQSFEFKSIKLNDTFDHTTASLNGTISHHYFKNWALDLSINSIDDTSFKLLNTSYEPNKLYYGQGYFSGSATIKGPTRSLDISIDGKTAAGTRIKIPIEDAQSVGDYEFINFIERSNPKNEIQEVFVPNYSGLDLSFNLEVTPEAEVEIVIDPSTGSSIRGTGSGNIFMDINTLGKFNMFGEFVVETGTYAYKFGGFIDKKFKVNSGGRISWEGDPLMAQLNLEAAYSLYANPAPLLEDPGYTQRIPTDVIVRLNGALENPNIDFDIEFPGTNSVIKSELLYALQDPTVQDRNAFFLLAQGSFVNDATGLNQQAVTGNLLQSASGFLNSILDSNNDKVTFGVSYEQGFLDRQSNLQTDNEIGFSLSTQLSDRVLFNGRLGVPIGGGITENVVGGDAELQLLLNEDGTLSAKVFNRENQYHQLLLDYQGYTQGIGLTYRVDFNSMSELIRKFWGKDLKSIPIDN